MAKLKTPEVVLLELTKDEARAIARLCCFVSGGGKTREHIDAVYEVLASYEGTDVLFEGRVSTRGE